MQDKTRIFGMSTEELDRHIRAAERRARKPLIDKIKVLNETVCTYQKAFEIYEAKFAKADALAEAAENIKQRMIEYGDDGWYREDGALWDLFIDALAAYREE